MKKILGIAFILFIGTATVSNAQTVKKSKEAIKTGAKKTGNKTAEVASKGAARVTDRRLNGKTGPNNETIYIDSNSKYYWVDKKGKRHYIAYSSLKTKV
ncbi:MAG: hypothetical protein ACXWCZ_02015 [Flavisolibacter sp.]